MEHATEHGCSMGPREGRSGWAGPGGGAGGGAITALDRLK
jgi:hypothetical protein